MKIAINYVNSDKGTAQILRYLREEIASVKRCDEWRRQKGIEAIRYDLTTIRKDDV